MIDIGIIDCEDVVLADNIIDAAEFYLKILLHQSFYEKLEIDIIIDYEMDNAGHSYPIDEEVFPKIFEVKLNPENCEEDLLQVLAHEMVHVAQFAKADLYNYMSLQKEELMLGTKWKQEIWEPNSWEHPYYDAPWEVEAFGKEYGLYRRWLESKEIVDVA